MRTKTLAQWIGGLGLALATQACVVRETQTCEPRLRVRVRRRLRVRECRPSASPRRTRSRRMPPEPLYEQMSVSPGYGHVWIDGYWHWNGYEWVWVGGRWERQQAELRLRLSRTTTTRAARTSTRPATGRRPDRVAARLEHSRSPRWSSVDVVPPRGGGRPPPWSRRWHALSPRTAAIASGLRWRCADAGGAVANRRRRVRRPSVARRPPAGGQRPTFAIQAAQSASGLACHRRSPVAVIVRSVRGGHRPVRDP